MTRMVLLLGWVTVVSSCAWASIAMAQAPVRSAGLSELAISEGHWVYHGHMLNSKGGQSIAWTWNERCRWAENHAFMICSFSNDWGGKHVNSIVIDTYDTEDRQFWHYEVFNSGSAAGKPFASKMYIDGSRRLESWVQKLNSKARYERIVYVFSGSSRVKVKFEQSTNGKDWKVTAIGTGKKLR